MQVTQVLPVVLEHVLRWREGTFFDGYLTEMPLCTRRLFNYQLLYITEIHRFYEERADLKTAFKILLLIKHFSRRKTKHDLLQ